MNKTRYFLFAIFVLITGFFSGPKVDQSFYPKKFAIPESVEEYIKNSESVLTDIRPNNEKKIIWFDESKKQKTKVSIVYLHGYGASRNEIAPICDLLAKEFKANLFYTRLAGHGRSFDAMGEPSVSDWLNDSIEAIEIGEKIGEKVILVGTSTGATLGIWLLAETEKKNSIQASIFLSPNF